jgi:limonene-1,2-epoxide hydrolase
MEPENILKEFFAAWSRLDVERIMKCFADGAVFHNVPLQPATGKDEIRKTM